MSRLLLLLLSLFAVVSAHATERLRLASGEWPPYAGATLPHEGIAARVIREALAEEDIKVEFVYLSWKRGLELARRGHLDGAILWQGNSWDSDFLVSEPIVQSEVVLAYRSPAALDNDTLTIPRGVRVGLPNGYKYEQIPAVQALLDQSAGDPVVVSDDAHGLSAMERGRIHILPIDRGVARWLLRGKPTDIRLRTQAIQTEPLSVLLYRHHVRNPHWHARLNAGISRLRESGRLAAILNGRD